MLSRLLRRLLLSQVLAGSLLGWLITWQTASSPWFVAVPALGLPFLTLLLLNCATFIKSRAPGANALWWRSLWGEYWAAIRIFVLWQPWTTRSAVIRSSGLPGASRIPVVLVHGYLCNHRVWDTLAPRLSGAGHPVLAIDLEPLFVSIDEYAASIEEAVAALCRQTGWHQVVLIGHSMGGLAIRAWMRAHGNDRAACVITLGTPHAGTRIAPHNRTPNGRQMCWHSSWLHRMAGRESAATRNRMRIVITPQDNIVYPQREQVLQDVPVTVFEGLGHLELCLNRAVIDWILQQLDDPALPLYP